MTRPSRDSVTVSGLRIWLRREPGEPAVFGVRFSLDRGVGFLRLPEAWGRASGPAHRSGAVAGLTASDLGQVHLVHRVGSDDDWRELALLPPEGPEPLALAPGRWVTLADGPMPGIVTEDGVGEDPPDDDDDVLLVDVSPGEGLDLEEADTSLQAMSGLGRRSGAGEGRVVPHALVRSLVRRIRSQEAELKTLRARVAQLEAAQARWTG